MLVRHENTCRCKSFIFRTSKLIKMTSVKGLDGNAGALAEIMRKESYFIITEFCPTSISDKAVNDLKTAVNNKPKMFVFNHIQNENIEGDETIHDVNRQQLLLTFNYQPPFLQNISALTYEAMRKVFKCDFKQSYASVLFSKPGCAQQDFHYDYPPDRFTSWKSFGCIVFLEDGGKLLIKRGKQILQPTFKRGDIVVFRGTKLHAGAAYDSENLRIHYYFDCLCDVKIKVRSIDATYPDHAYEQSDHNTARKIYNLQKASADRIKHNIELTERLNRKRCRVDEKV